MERPKKTISAAAREARPGDTVTVHAGIYRERVAPPRGGESDARRIVYRAAPGEIAEIRGSEIVRGWKPLGPGTWQGARYIEDPAPAPAAGNNKAPAGMWKAVIPNSFFGDFNPYKDVLGGDWYSSRIPLHTGEVYLDGRSLYEAEPQRVFNNTWDIGKVGDPESARYRWYCESDYTNTTIYANFCAENPNEHLVEINVRRAVFYPEKPGINYLTVRGFTMRHAATPWAPPTAEQVGLLGTHWSKGWIIEDNVISDSRCAGITLGKYGDEFDNKAGTADGYHGTIRRALARGWSRDLVGSHVVRNNTVHDCGQAGICGSLGAIFSRITGNHVFNIYTKRQFGGYEMAGIKIHAAVDVLLENNRIHNAYYGFWLDWMAQGTRITGNLCYDNSDYDLVVEMNHGPFVVDNNVFLSPSSLLNQSEGGAYAHNLFAGKIDSQPDRSRSVPFLKPHSTEVAGSSNTRGGADRFYNNIFMSPVPLGEAEMKKSATPGGKNTGFGLWVFDGSGELVGGLPRNKRAVSAGNNAYFNGARPFAGETNPSVFTDFDPEIKFSEENGRGILHIHLGEKLKNAVTVPVAGEMLGLTETTGKLALPYENFDGTPLVTDKDFSGKKRDPMHPTAGPFENPGNGDAALKLW